MGVGVAALDFLARFESVSALIGEEKKVTVVSRKKLQ